VVVRDEMVKKGSPRAERLEQGVEGEKLRVEG
jgi:hypothetical protein